MKFPLLSCRLLADGVLRNSRFCLRPSGYGVFASLLLALALLAGCTVPIGARKATPGQTLREINGSALNDRRLGSHAFSTLRRFDQQEVFDRSPDAVLRLLHQKALETGEPDLLFALAELNHLAAERLRRSVKPWEPRDARDYDLASACYAYLYLFDPTGPAAADVLDNRYRQACDLYNVGLGWALTGRRATNSVAILAAGTRHLPNGQIELELEQAGFPWHPEAFERFLLADHFVVRGLSVRNRQRGLGAPLIGVLRPQDDTQLSRAVPATVFLRLHGGLRDLASVHCRASLELYSSFGTTTLEVNGQTVPLETDTTVPMAYTLNQQSAWRLGPLQFLSARERYPNGIYLTQPYERGRVPVVFVHGTASSPVWWAEMINTLRADPLLCQRCQFWFFVYNSGNPVPFSARKLREALADKIHELEPDGQDPTLQRLVIIGHSQGGLLAKFAVTDTSDRLWRAINTNRLEDLPISEDHRALIRRFVVYEPLPFVQRVVFMCTPHRGSYRASGWVRGLSSRCVSLPGKVLEKSATLLRLAEKVNLPPELQGRLPTSVDGMSPENPFLLALAELPPAADVSVHSIIAVKGDGDFHSGKDGVVAYPSAHVDYANSEFIVRSGHSCQAKPAAIEEVRRILHEHLKAHTR